MQSQCSTPHVRDAAQAAAALPMLDMCEAMAVELGGLFREPIPPVAGIIDAVLYSSTRHIEKMNLNKQG